MMLFLKDITGFENEDVEARATVNGVPPMELLSLAIGERREEYAALCEEYAPTIVALADSIRSRGLVFRPWVVRSATGNRDRGFVLLRRDGGYVVVGGGRRVLALAYNHARHGAPPAVELIS